MSPSFVVSNSGDDSGLSSSRGTSTDIPIDIDSRASSDIDSSSDDDENDNEEDEDEDFIMKDDVDDTRKSNCNDETSTDVEENTNESVERGETEDEDFISPYEFNECEEDGEDCFDELKNILLPIAVPGGNEDQINPKMELLFGDVLARALYNAHIEIAKSGMIYSPSWREGKIRGRSFGWIPRRQLLLVLHEQRFARSDVAILQAIVKNLNCFDLTVEAMKNWNFVHTYPNLASNLREKTFIFDNQKIRCCKCEIFVARAFATLQILRKSHEISQSLTNKIKKCLNIMNKYVRPNQKELTRLQQKSKKYMHSASSSHHHEVKTRTRPLVEITMDRRNETSDTESGVTRSDVTTDSSSRIDDANHTTRPHKIQKCEEDQDESILISFDIMHTQVQRINQMMSLFQSQLQDHRGILKEEIAENT
jgi:hypothetical protein